MADKRSSTIIGTILIVLGAAFLFRDMFNIDFDAIWPLVFLVLAGVMLSAYNSNQGRNTEVLIPLFTFLMLWVVFQYCALFGWHNMSHMWPGFMLGPGLGFLAVYFKKRETGMLIPGSILVGLSLIFFISMSPFANFWPVLLILVGLAIIVFPGMRKSNGDQEPS